jgi:hypothetical protein
MIIGNRRLGHMLLGQHFETPPQSGCDTAKHRVLADILRPTFETSRALILGPAARVSKPTVSETACLKRLLNGLSIDKPPHIDNAHGSADEI